MMFLPNEIRKRKADRHLALKNSDIFHAAPSMISGQTLNLVLKTRSKGRPVRFSFILSPIIILPLHSALLSSHDGFPSQSLQESSPARPEAS
jgi:hypothetical protein